jgi:hypothetical protein
MKRELQGDKHEHVSMALYAPLQCCRSGRGGGGGGGGGGGAWGRSQVLPWKLEEVISLASIAFVQFVQELAYSLPC